MKKICILTDSYVGMTEKELKDFDVKVVPMPIIIDEETYYEGINITRDEFFEKIKTCKTLSTSQPSITDVIKIWDEMLVDYEKILYIPLSSGMSGTYNTVLSLSKDEKYDGKVIVSDAKKVSAPMYQIIMDAIMYRDKGYEIEKINEMINASAAKQRVFLALDTFEYIKRGGRIMGIIKIAGSVLNIKPVVVFDTGVTKLYKMSRGFTKAMQEIIEGIKRERETAFKYYSDKKQVVVMTATAFADDIAKAFEKEVEKAFPDLTVKHMLLPLVLCLHSGPGAVGACICVKNSD